MLKLDAHTRGLFISGVFVYVTTISGLVYNYSLMQENHSVRIVHLENNVKGNTKYVKSLGEEVGALRTETATVVTMLSSLDQTVLQLTKSTIELGKIAARLDERSKGE